MSKGMIYNSRLMPPHFEKWFQMCKTAEVDVSVITRGLIESFASMEDSLLYITSVHDEIVGGTALFRDRKRLGMALASVVIAEEYRDRLLRNLIKSSLPFFRTAAIRDVDALVGPSSYTFPQFPYSFVLPEWTRSALENLDFSSAGQIKYLVIQEPFKPPTSPIKWATAPSIDAIQSFIWDQRHYTGFDSSHVWLSLNFGLKNGTIRTIVQNQEIVLVVVYSKYKSVLVIQLIVWDNERLDDTYVANALLSLKDEFNVTQIHVLINEKYSHLLSEIVPTSENNIQQHKIIIFRKLL